MTLRKTLSIFFVLIFYSTLSFTQVLFDTNESISLIKENVEKLASEEFEGRETGTKGELLASEFISSKLGEYGVHPFGDDGTYFQNFELLMQKFETASVTLIDESLDNLFLESGKNFYLSNRNFPDPAYSGINSEIVFAGYGLETEDGTYNDYDEIDVSGKTVFLLSGLPSDFVSTVEGDMSGSKLKYNLAKEKGAVGIIYITDGWIKKYWDYVLRTAYDTDAHLRGLNQDDSKNIPVAYLDDSTASRLFQDELKSLSQIIQEAEQNNPVPFKLNKKIIFNYSVSLITDTVRNVIGIVEGTDPVLKNEYIALSAHYDHEGIKNEKIYFGADDNASGTSAVMEVGRRLAEMEDNKRSVLTIFHTGEEKGLLGSKYFTANSEIIGDIVANINLDMIGRESIDTLFSVGSGKLSSQLYELVEKVNSETVNFVFDYKFDDPKDPQRIYYRSDHYNYARKGIPIVFFHDYMTTDYHKPTDTADKINFAKIEKVSTLVTGLTLKIANLDERLIVDKQEEVPMESGR